jgi:DNA-binding CsgD family transcriptional regulator
LTFQTGYLTNREVIIWDLRRTIRNQSDIARRLKVSRQAIHRALHRIDKKVELALKEAAETNKLELRKLDKVNGILTAYSPAYEVPVVVSLSKANGLNVWYLYEGNCSECNQRLKCRELLLNEAKERGIKLNDDIETPPTILALDIFSKYLEEEKVG